jgi:hypothetical protein
MVSKELNRPVTKAVGGMRCAKPSDTLRRVASAARIKSASPTSAMLHLVGDNSAPEPAGARPALRERHPLGAPTLETFLGVADIEKVDDHRACECERRDAVHDCGKAHRAARPGRG